MKALLKRWFGKKPDAAKPVIAPVVRGHMELSPGLLGMMGAVQMIRREVQAPRLPPGVVPVGMAYDANNDPGKLGPYLALDSGTVAPFYSFANQFNCGLGFPGYAYLAELAQRSEYRAPCETIADEMTREWVELRTNAKPDADTDTDTDDEADDTPPGDAAPESAEVAAPTAPSPEGGDEDKIKALTDAIDEFGVRNAFHRVAELDGFFGRVQLYIDIEGQDTDERRQLPLVVAPETIPKGSLKRFVVIEPIWTTPYTYNAQDPTAVDFFKPKAWYVLGKKTHASRLLTFIGREVPDLLKPAYNFGGISMTQLMEPYVNQWLRTRNSVSDLIHNFSVMILKTDMNSVLAGKAAASSGLVDRAKLFTQTRDNQNLTLINKDTEEMDQIAVPLSGLDELQAQAQEHMAAPSHIPLVKLTGITPSGLNASSEGEIQVFYDFVAARQQTLFSKHLKTVLDVLQCHLFGEIDDTITFEFLPLTAPTVKELSEIRKSDADAAVGYINAGVIDPDEERERLMADPNSGYSNLTGPAPEPPEPELPPGMGGEEGGGGGPPFGGS
jgi:uncharacterized protein